MSDLASFAEVIKKAHEDKKLRESLEKTRKKTEVAPLLSELFASVAKAKEVDHATQIKEAPLLAELQSALADPEKFLSEKQDKKNRIVELVTELEVKAAGIQTKIDIPKTESKIVVTDLEKKFLKLFNRLQNDFQTLKKHIDSKSNSTGSYFGTPGSGEVRILRMDDVVKGSNPVNGSVMTWDSSLNKFKFVLPLNTGVNNISDEEMPFAKRTDFVGDDIIYRGEAVVGSVESSPVWRIRKIFIGVDGDVTETWVNGDALYDKKWSDRLTLNYS